MKKFIVYSLMSLQVIAGFPANAVTISQTPVGLTVKPNIIFALDDSGSMDSEVMQVTNDGAVWWNTDKKSFIGFDKNDTYSSASTGLNFNKGGSANNSPWIKYVYLFPNGTGTGDRQYKDDTDCTNCNHFAIAPVEAYANFRSSSFNPLYYNPSNTYIPWVAAYSGGDKTYTNASPTAAKSHPASGSSTIDLTKIQGLATNADTTATAAGSNYTFRTQTGMPSFTTVKVMGDDKTSVGTTYATIPYLPATYWIKLATPTTACPTGFSCADAIDGNRYQKVEIIPTTSQTANTSPATGYGFPSGRSYADEIQNFANWFQYARKRKLMLAYAMGQVFYPSSGSQLTGVNVGIIRFGATTTAPTMYDIDSTSASSNAKALLWSIYTNPANGGTPTKTALLAIGNYYSNSTKNANIVKYSCQKNAAFILTDGYANNAGGDTSKPSYTSPYSEDTYGGTAPYKTTYSNSLADIALRYYTNPITASGSTPLAMGQVPKDTYNTVNVDINTNPHMNTYALTLGAIGDVYGNTYITNSSTGMVSPNPFTTPPTWVAQTADRSPIAVDDLWHSTINGRGQMFTSSNPVDTATQISNGVRNIIMTAGTRASIGVASKYLNASNNYVYVPSYNATGWLGDVKKYTVNLATAEIDTTTSIWSAKAQLAAVSNPATTRKIVTYNGTGGASFDASTTGLSTELVSYVRGDNSLEKGSLPDLDPTHIYRTRAALFGDVINASPTVVTSGGKTTVYQASNDGMLHAIDAINGNELWAYIPQAVWGQFANFASPTGSHEYIVDGTPIAVKVGAKTILVGGLGYNTKASTYYALDITTPTAASESEAATKVMWEFPKTDAIRANLGTSTSRPLIINTKAFTGYPQVVVVSSGYNNNISINGNQGDGKGHVWFLDPETGTVLKEIVTATGSTTTPIGLAPLLGYAVNPKIDTTATALYGGDALGNVWKFDISGNKDSWATTNSKIIATLRTSGGVVQHITSAVQLSVDPIDLKPLVFIGTGQLLNSADASDTTTQSFYAIKDKGDSINRVRPDVSTVPTGSTKDSTWVKKVITLDPYQTNTSIADRLISNPTGVTFDWATNNAWYFDFIATGERVVGNIQFSTDRLLFSTTVISANTCTNPSFTYSLDSNGNQKYPVEVTVDPKDLPTWVKIVRTNPDGTVVYFDSVGGHYTGQASSNSPLIIIIQSGTYGVQTDANGKITVFKINTLAGGSRLASWREIIRK